MAFEVKKLSKALGAEVTGVDLCSVSDDDIENIKSLLVDNMVLFFPGQTISQEEHV